MKKDPHELVERFLEAKRGDLAAAQTIKTMTLGLARFLRFLAEVGIADLAEASVSVIRDYLLTTFEGLKTYTMRHHRYVLSRFFHWCHRSGHLLSDPCAALDPAPAPDNLPRRILGREEIKKFLEIPDLSSLVGVRDRAMLELLYSCGLRRGELARLRLRDYLPEEGILQVESTKTRSWRIVPVGTVAAMYLHRYLEQVRPKLDRRGKHDEIFLSFVHKQPISVVTIGLRIHKYARMFDELAAKQEEGKPSVSAHCLRHTAATHLLQKGADTRFIQAYLGHKRLGSTQIYTRVFPADLVAMMKRCHPRWRLLERCSDQEPGLE